MFGKIKIKQILFISILTLGMGAILYFMYTKAQDPAMEEMASTYLIKGIDISHHNTILDWSKVKSEDVSFVYMKATEGVDHLDRNYQLNYEMAREQGIAVGAYHFYIFGSSGREQAKHFIGVAKNQVGDMIPAIDVEHSSANPHSRDRSFVNKTIRELKELESALHDHYGVHPLLYTNKECYKLYVDGNFPDNLIWIVDLDNEPSNDIKNWRIWQFSHSGRVAGTTGKIDLNFYRYSANEFSELFIPY